MASVPASITPKSDREEAIAGFVHTHSGARVEFRQAIGELPTGHDCGDELEMRVVGRAHDRKRPPDQIGVRISECNPRVVAGGEPEARGPTRSERHQSRRPVTHCDDALDREPGGNGLRRPGQSDGDSRFQQRLDDWAPWMDAGTTRE